ncbi:DNA mismatch repair protein MutL [Legionella beliardensis]|uniref:DNA mismatch repair protein MutL n=1 Tax=Legionella beliardensis TaxID=91822 RepID=A0A378I4T5_9GAMM|nr:DNA mismatch repair endonuclease MutL [Legionella beliardensis]STX29852.1 DNA mismatch repair protein MutL [Legionella beliardensis]
MRIQQLPTEVANQIAAGEVIERPASVVKELLENALDAGADMIHIDIGFGGLNQIKISDNGIGIVADDLPLAIAPHATSKITTIADLAAIESLGFRGEALASIASVSKLTISSKPAMQEHGMLLEYQNQHIKLLPFPRVKGTTVEVCDLFYNAPVRKKFLKTEQTEFQAIDTLVRRFALSAPHITIKLNHNGKPVLTLPAATEAITKQARIGRLLGKQFIEQAHYIDAEYKGLKLYGWISGTQYQRSQNDKLWVYINGRMVKDKLINHAIKQVYEAILHPGRHPACALYLIIDPQEIDVNVHPTKHEVRFQQPRLIHDFINTQLRHVLNLPNQATSRLKAWPPAPLKEPLQIRENTNSSFWQNQQNQYNTSSPWIPLNQRFTLVYLAQKPYLVDLRVLQQHWLVHSLKKASLPLAARALLVPIYVDIPELTFTELQLARDLLANAGIDIHLAKNQKIIVHSLPQLLPNLNIKGFLNSFFALPHFNLERLFALLTENDSQEDIFLTEEQCLDYISHLEALSLAGEKFIKHLSEEICQDLLYGS